MYSHPSATSAAAAPFIPPFVGPIAPPDAPLPVAAQAIAEAKPLTITARILAYLQDGHSITPLEALANYGCFRLADAIFRLKGQGWVIGTYLKKDPNGKTYARYSMMKRFDKFTVPADGASMYVRTVADLVRNGEKGEGRLVTMYSGITYAATDELRLVA